MYATLATTLRPCRTRNQSNNVYVRPTFKQTAFRQPHALLSQAFRQKTSLKKSDSTSIRFHYDNVMLYLTL